MPLRHSKGLGLCLFGIRELVSATSWISEFEWTSLKQSSWWHFGGPSDDQDRHPGRDNLQGEDRLLHSHWSRSVEAVLWMAGLWCCWLPWVVHKESWPQQHLRHDPGLWIDQCGLGDWSHFILIVLFQEAAEILTRFEGIGFGSQEIVGGQEEGKAADTQENWGVYMFYINICSVFNSQRRCPSLI